MPARCPRRRDWPTATGARLAWIPRRAGDRGALDAGCLPNLLPGGRPVADPDCARNSSPTAWHIAELPADAGPRHHRDPGRRRATANSTHCWSAGSNPADLPDPHAALAAIEAAGFVVSLELRESAVTALADVVFPVAPGGGEGRFLHQLGGPGTGRSSRR